MAAKLERRNVELGRILAARFNHVGRDYYGFRFASGEKVDFYDETGNSLRKAFLKAPLKYERISSRYTLKRFHPVQKRWKAHLGTDYAAPTGTPTALPWGPWPPVPRPSPRARRWPSACSGS